ncbi:MAG: hypothetical protein HKN47_01480, partial [Pirellulaceae bacterium]|nr:hypothetical protein [Pirellulaceae bacterium]
YEIGFKGYDAAATPITEGGARADDECTFLTSYSEGPSLSGFSVGSNRIRMVHAEQIVDVGGGISRQGETLVNDTAMELMDVFVLDKSPEGDVRIATVGILSPQSTTKLQFETRNAVSVSDDLPMQTAQMIRRVASPLVMAGGSTRMVGRYDGSIDGMSIAPSANQTSAQTIVLAHLKHSPLPDPKPDVNLISDFRRVQTGQQNTEEQVE